MRILYVEDNPANLFLVQRVARMGDHEVIHYVEGQPALDRFKEDKPDLVLMDIQLPGKLTGLDVVKTLRAAGHKTPIIAVTAYAMSGDREKCLAAGCDGYLAKPLPVGELVELFKRYAVEVKPPPAPEAPTAVAAQPTATPTADVTPSETPPAEVKPVEAVSVAATVAQASPAVKPAWSGDETVPSRPTLEMKAASAAKTSAEPDGESAALTLEAAPADPKTEVEPPKPEVAESKASHSTPVSVEAAPASAPPEKQPDSPTAQPSAINGTSEKVKVESGQ